MENEMSQLGLGVMINQLCGDSDSDAVLTGAVGKTLASGSLGDDDALHLAFNDGSKVKIFDGGQSCCEHRYMRTDDDLNYFEGAKFLGVEIKDAPTVIGEYGDEHEVSFLEVKTDKGCFTMASHNEHNGYYGGFYIKAEAE